jgi:hypothetical protein
VNFFTTSSNLEIRNRRRRGVRKRVRRRVRRRLRRRVLEREGDEGEKGLEEDEEPTVQRLLS